jgi:hypothetical protein
MIPLVIHDLQDSQLFALAQAAGRAGIPVAGTGWPVEPWAKKSRYIGEVVELRCLSEVLAGVYALGLKHSGLRGVWLPCSDDVVRFTVNYRALMRNIGMHFIVPDEEAMDRAVNQETLPDVHGLKIAPMYVVSAGELVKNADEYLYPIIIKSKRDAYMKVASSEELRRLLDPVVAGQPDASVRIQSFIEGDVSRMASAMFLFDDEGRPVRGFTGRRLAVASTDHGPFGETVAARAEWVPELYEGARELLRTIGWKGFAEVECKQEADGQWYVMEINPRLSGWMCLAEADGAGMLEAYYRICTEGVRLDERVLQRSSKHYLRMIGTCDHYPCWDPAPMRPERGRRKIWRLLKATGQCLISGGRMQVGSWDRRDLLASASIAWDSLHRARRRHRWRQRQGQ